MNLKLNPFINAVHSMRVDVKTRQKIVAVAIGYAIACNAPLPSSQVASAAEHYNTTVLPAVRRIASQFNEGFVFDLAFTQEFARNFWLMRYDAVHSCPRMDQIPGNFFCSVFGVAKYFGGDDVAFCDANNQDIAAVYRSACAYINEINQPLAGDQE